MSEPEDLESCKARSPFRSRSPVVVSPRGFGVPAALLAGLADFVDLDGPLLLARDREPGLKYDEGGMAPPSSDLWG